MDNLLDVRYSIASPCKLTVPVFFSLNIWQVLEEPMFSTSCAIKLVLFRSHVNAYSALPFSYRNVYLCIRTKRRCFLTACENKPKWALRRNWSKCRRWDLNFSKMPKVEFIECKVIWIFCRVTSSYIIMNFTTLPCDNFFK